jgi:hypothetical protein
MIGPDASRVRVRLELELGVRDEEHLLEQVVEVLLLLRGDVRELRRPAPLLRLQALLRQLGRRGRSRRRDVDLVDGDDDRHLAARACEIDSFVCGMTPSSAATTSTRCPSPSRRGRASP